MEQFVPDADRNTYDLVGHSQIAHRFSVNIASAVYADQLLHRALFIIL